MTVSLLDPLFLLLLGILVVSRRVWPQRHYSLLGAILSMALIGWGAPKTAIAITCITFFYLYPVHRLTCLAVRKAWSPSALGWIQISSVSGLIGFLVLFKLHKHFTIPWAVRCSS